jgi:hypothetical protein
MMVIFLREELAVGRAEKAEVWSRDEKQTNEYGAAGLDRAMCGH